ncbi:CGNR zinc finger domain-containing protein [Zhihengliuella alba]|uniref:CGNR zinc finger domain-containing protein n=1 Tax=Zhihengliuella alba TaxID=547018 RepID=A0ABP7CW16_9MICC
MQEISQPPAPGSAEHPSLALAGSLNDLPGTRGFDDLADPEAATAWLAARDLISPDAVLYELCRGRLVGLRAHLRALFAARVSCEAPPAGAIQALNDALTSVPGARLLRHDPVAGFRREADHPATQVVEHAMATIAEDAASLLTGAEAPQLAECEAGSCQRFFLRTHARRQWCSNRCGDRVRAARAYARKRVGSGV